ncbi:MAG TPA: D-sedoheptulose 7-phosphate isomerase [Saprospiraceae bacterium]|nr:D-sedoheptulose 7-phosphate isomerase [Saprospiraceae bacterium]HNM24925.1 D-sedoheptulose 7-phosphate isomerase [Saprospiraceae bacterium]
MRQLIHDKIAASIATKQAVLADLVLLQKIEQAARAMIDAFRADGKVLFCGNGGSAADAQHIAAELSGRFYTDRPPLFAEALHVNSSYVTAVANDYGYEQVFARMVEAAGRPGDVLVAISTSGNSPSILQAVEKAASKGMKVVGMTGTSGGKMAERCHVLLNVPSTDTPRIQEVHILIGHILCELVEKEIFG